jgi:hypothetical protein
MVPFFPTVVHYIASTLSESREAVSQHRPYHIVVLGKPQNLNEWPFTVSVTVHVKLHGPACILVVSNLLILASRQPQFEDTTRDFTSNGGQLI